MMMIIIIIRAIFAVYVVVCVCVCVSNCKIAAAQIVCHIYSLMPECYVALPKDNIGNC